MALNLKPLADRLVVEPIEQEEVTASGIYVPETAKEKPQEGKVVAVGPGLVESCPEIGRRAGGQNHVAIDEERSQCLPGRVEYQNIVSGRTGRLRRPIVSTSRHDSQQRGNQYREPRPASPGAPHLPPARHFEISLHVMTFPPNNRFRPGRGTERICGLAEPQG